jgi:superfamily I DNA/RNA helicase
MAACASSIARKIKHALAYLRLIANPDDDTAFARVVNFPTRGIGTRSIEALQEAARCANSSLYNAAASLAGKAGHVGRPLRPPDRGLAPARPGICSCPR